MSALPHLIPHPFLFAQRCVPSRLHHGLWIRRSSSQALGTRATARQVTEAVSRHAQTPGLFVEAISGQYLPMPAVTAAPVKHSVSTGLTYSVEGSSAGLGGPLFSLAGALENFSLRFTGAPSAWGPPLVHERNVRRTPGSEP